LALLSVGGSAVAETKPPSAVAKPPVQQLTRRGVVQDVIDSPMYTYLLVAGDAGPVWLAAYKNDIAKGATVRYSDGVVMRSFYSKSIKKTFDKIIFVDSVVSLKN
jgi:hypothetical protein